MSEPVVQRQAVQGTEYDVMCGRCGSSMAWNDCFNCGGDGTVDCDPIQCCDEHTCSRCDGLGGWFDCLSSEEYCQAHPTVADVPRHTAHWFEIVVAS